MEMGKYRSIQITAGILLVMSLVYGISVNAKEIVVDATPEQQVTTDTAVPATTEKATEATTTENGEISGNGWNAAKDAYYKNGVKVTGWQTIEDKTYYFTSKGNLYTKTGMRKINDVYYYFDSGHYILTGPVTVKKKTYYFLKSDGSRYEETGINKVEGKYYCFKDNYSLVSGWYRNSKNKRYYFDKTTYAALTDWNYVGKYKYYFNKKGQLLQDVRKKLTKKQKESYEIRVNRTASCVTVYAQDGDNGYTIPVVAFICSAGHDTPKGEFTIQDKLRWHELMGPCWGQWCMHLTTDILFHSVYYDKEKDKKSLNVKAYNKLGTMASHGCIRMRAGDCKWIYDNCDVGTKVIIYNKKKNPGPFDKPKIKKLSASHTWDPTDPTVKKK